MTDLKVNCPKCGIETTNYFHFVDNCGMGKQIPNGVYPMRCTQYYTNENPKDFCGHAFKVKLTNKQILEITTEIVD